ncbi:glycosyl hydrolase family 95 catalytic domain-containing protein [Haloferula sp. A504]|uniref:glycosyl hydrolase family 95 catalytic domain-containing protein n=1 Tax=Haloferula sp. A504 TaxID=3373601 RepID=UPI0031C3E56E|nr:glycoside hydrolase family 95 protein [Verrucomicrobiaceae bacterium E54]
MKTTLHIARILALFSISMSPALSSSLPVPDRGFLSSRPAANWEEGLICGNGTLGMLAFSHPNDERIIFTHEELFMPMGDPVVPPDQSMHLPEIRSLIAEGKYKEAEALQAKYSGQDGFMYPDYFVPAFDLQITQPGGEARDYARTVDFSTSEARIKWTNDLGTFERGLFCSRKDRIAVVRLQAEKPGSLNATLKLVPRKTSDEFNKDTDIAKKSSDSFKEHFGDIESRSTSDSLSYSMQCLKAYEGSITAVNGHARVITKGGKATAKDDGSLVVENADEVLLLVDIALPREKGSDLFDELAAKLDKVEADYDKLLSSQAKLHGELFNRVRLDLGGSAEDHKKSTEELLEISTWEDINMALLEKEFDAGRHNIISSTGKLPPNLQGIWGGTYVPNWASDFTHNGNVPSAIAANLPGNMPELTPAYTSYIESLIPDLQLNAKHLFGARGIVLPSRTSTNGYNNAYSENFAGGMWVAGAGKAARFFYDYYLFTGDEEFLAKHAVPYLEQCALFFEDYLYEDENGQFVFSPTQSPENWPEGSDSQATFNATMDVAVAKEVLHNLIAASRTLDINADKIPKWKGMLAKMPPYMLNEDGIIKEWLTPKLGNNDKHRHSSQLYPLYYVMPEEIEQDPKLVEGFRKSVEFKLAEHWKDPEDRGFMSFGLVQLGQVVSTLGDGELSLLCLRHLVNRFWLNNLASMHNHRHLFNMDISGGQPALIIQMLVGSDVGEVKLLPALPKEWKTGTLEGVLCRGAIEINRLHWTPGKVEVAMTSKEAQTIDLILPGQEPRKVELSAGETVKLELPRKG